MPVSLDRATPASLDLDPKSLERLLETVTRHIAEGRYPGAQLAVARHGKLALFETIGDARIDPARATASEDTLWLLYSNTKVITACAVWLLVERGALSFTDRVAEHLPGFEQNAKGDITVIQLLTHQAGFPTRRCPRPCGRIMISCARPSAGSRSSGRRVRACTITGSPRTGRPRP